MPVDTPDEVKKSPSSTQRTCGCQSTFGPCEQTHSKAALLPVARLPSNSPPLASRALPVQTLVTSSALDAATLNQSSSCPPRRLA